MSSYENISKINQEREQCRVAFGQLHSKNLITDHYGLSLCTTFSEPQTTLFLSNKDRVDYLSKAALYMNDIVDNFNLDIDPKFTKLLKETDIEFSLLSIFKKMNITTLGDLVGYTSFQDFELAYQKSVRKLEYKRSNSSIIPKGIERKLEKFMIKNQVLWNMDTTLSHVHILQQEKVRLENEQLKLQQQKTIKLLSLSFDLSNTQNQVAMKEFGIENISGVFTKLFDSGITNFKELCTRYNSVDDIDITQFGRVAKATLQEYMKQHHLSFGMYVSA